MERNGAGKRRSRRASTASHQGESNTLSSGNSSSGIDSFLQRLDDIDLSHRKKSDRTSAPSSALDNHRDVESSSSSSAQINNDHDDDKKSTTVAENPGNGAAAFVLVYGTCVVLLLPGTPLTLGGGYVYKVTYGLAGGVTISQCSVGRIIDWIMYMLRFGEVHYERSSEKVGKEYPLFDSIDIAVSDNGFKIMCLLYLTPILPLGPVAYTCGTTSMPLVTFAAAKIGAAPLTLLYAFIGASTDTFFGSSSAEAGSTNKKMGMDEETHKKMVLFGLVLSVLSMSLVSHVVKKELYKIFDKQKKDKQDKEDDPSDSMMNGHEPQLEMTSRNETLQRRQRGHDHDEEKG
ncbi:SNARE associated Golgi protein [Skeletonema marinoi]|uniref:SNARE associated Golgi protein n=1 Tax=Skeletonema marinoi TaxID=267567 RepID=A0AAD8YKU5_9STRA|nr:SNARE associated Golgi protein [Skeletonema marinoi]